MTKQKEKKTILTPVGRLINESLFEKSQFDEKATPVYTLEMAFSWDDAQVLDEELAAHAVEKWGAGAADDYFDYRIISPILDGDKLAARREENGKPGEAYRGLAVVRAKTLYNKDGQDAPGGIQVYSPEVEEIGPANRQEIYPGCWGQAALKIATYDDRGGDHALMFYLHAFQKTKDGERLITGQDYSEVYKPVGRQEGRGPARRRKRG